MSFRVRTSRWMLLSVLCISAGALLPPVTQADNCTYTQGYWKNHPEDWPVTSLYLGNVLYTQEQLLAILGEPVMGNGLVSLSHQLIAVKLNIAFGADSTAVDPEVTEADALIGDLVVPPVGTGYLDPSVTGPYNDLFDQYNRGLIGPGHCGGGACCLPDGSCAVVTSDDCDKVGGEFAGPGVPCDPSPCIGPPSKGACCLPEGSCVMLTSEACSVVGGVFYGDKFTCDPSPCIGPPSKGACCLQAGSCVILTSEACSVAGGVYYGDGSSCDPSPCIGPPPTGACCIQAGACVVLTAEECTAQGGTYQGDDVPCDPTPCLPPPPPQGACCLNPLGDCEVMTMAACDALGGTYVGDGIGCNPGLCPPTATEPITWGRLKNRLHR